MHHEKQNIENIFIYSCIRLYAFYKTERSQKKSFVRRTTTTTTTTTTTKTTTTTTTATTKVFTW